MSKKQKVDLSKQRPREERFTEEEVEILVKIPFLGLRTSFLPPSDEEAQCNAAPPFSADKARDYEKCYGLKAHIVECMEEFLQCQMYLPAKQYVDIKQHLHCFYSWLSARVGATDTYRLMLAYGPVLAKLEAGFTDQFGESVKWPRAYTIAHVKVLRRFFKWCDRNGKLEYPVTLEWKPFELRIRRRRTTRLAR